MMETLVISFVQDIIRCYFQPMKRAPILTSRILEKTVAAICKKKKNRTRIITISLEQMEEKKKKNIIS